MNPDQLAMEIPIVDQKKTRRAVYAYLSVYRRYSYQLAHGIESRPRPTTPGYEDCMEPDLIRKQGNKLGAWPASPEEYREAFIGRVNYHVSHMAPYEREIIVRRLLTPRRGYRTIHDLPSDDEVLSMMKQDDWIAEKSYYDERKAFAIVDLAERLKIAVYQRFHVAGF